MGTIKLVLPDALHDRAHELATKNKVSINLLVATALAEKLLMLGTEENLAARSQKSMYHRFNKALSEVATNRAGPRASRIHQAGHDQSLRAP